MILPPHEYRGNVYILHICTFYKYSSFNCKMLALANKGNNGNAYVQISWTYQIFFLCKMLALDHRVNTYVGVENPYVHFSNSARILPL